MLQTIRDKITGWFAYVFLGAIGVVFIFWGVEMRTASGGGGNFAAKVNGDRISIESVNLAWQERQQELQQSFRGEIPEQFKKSIQDDILTEKIRTQLLLQQVDKLGYRVGNEELRAAVAALPNLQDNGKFSIQRYEFAARQQRMSTAQLDEDIRRRLLQRQLVNGVILSSFVTPAELQRREALEGENRDFDYVTIPMAGFMASAAVTDADIQSYYDTNKVDFMTPETVDLELVELRLADIEKDIVVTDEALRTYYEQSKDRLTTPERRLGRHILITVDDAVDDAKAKAKAEEILAKLKAGGDFAALAKEFSQDPISAAKGGELDWSPRGANMGPFDEALFAMQPGELRGPVKTQFGYHIVRLEKTEGGQLKSFDEARAELTREFKAEKAQTEFYDRAQKLGDETFSALTELEAPAKSLGLSTHRIAGVSRQGGAPGASLASDPKIIEAAFAPESLEKRQNSALLQLADDHVAVVRVTDRHVPEQKPLPVVRVEIETKLKDRAARDAAAKRGTELLTRVSGGADWGKTLSEFKLTASTKNAVTRNESSLPAALKQETFGVPRTAVTKDKPVYRGVRLESGDYAVVRLTAINLGKLELGTPDANTKREQAAQTLGGEEFNAYLLDIEKRADIERNPKVFE